MTKRGARRHRHRLTAGTIPQAPATKEAKGVGIFSEYISKKLNFDQISAERKNQLRRLAKARNRDVIVYAADLSKAQEGAPISIDYSDVLPISDQLTNCKGNALDVILETPGGDGTVAEDIVRIIRERYDDVAFIVPGYAKSAGTIIAMSGDEIVMGPTSALGPIDAQLVWQGKAFSAEALIEGMEKIKREVVDTGVLNKAYIPILQSVSPGELQSAQNALDFAKKLVTTWLSTYKFRKWTQHSSDGSHVTQQQRDARAAEIADELCSHQKWLSHGRSIRLADLERMKLRVTNFVTGDPEVADAISRYHVLMRMTFNSPVCKLIETVDSQIYKHFNRQSVVVQAPPQPQAPPDFSPANAPSAVVEMQCGTCGTVARLQANFVPDQPLEGGAALLPKAGPVHCRKCRAVLFDAAILRRDIEAQAGRRIIS